jgi:hypothetical protein
LTFITIHHPSPSFEKRRKPRAGNEGPQNPTRSPAAQKESKSFPPPGNLPLKLSFEPLPINAPAMADPGRRDLASGK